MADLAVWPTDGAGGSVSSEARWRRMARLWVPSGVDDTFYGATSLAPTLAAGPTINVAQGAAWLDGHYAELTPGVAVPATANGLLVVRFTPADNRAELLYRDAVTVPTQTDASWELAIAQMIAGAIRDVRQLSRYGGIVPPPMCLVRSTGAFSVPNAAVTAILFNAGNSTEQIDTHGMHDPAANPNRFTVPLRGVYDVKAYGSWTGALGGTLRVLYIRNAAATILVSDRRGIAGITGVSGTMEATPATDVFLNPGDWVEMAAYQDSGAALNLAGFQFSVTYKGPAPYGAGM